MLACTAVSASLGDCLNGSTARLQCGNFVTVKPVLAQDLPCVSAKQRRPSPILRFRDGESRQVASLAQAAGLGVIRFHDQVIGLDLRMPDHLQHFAAG